MATFNLDGTNIFALVGEKPEFLDDFVDLLWTNDNVRGALDQ